MGTQEHTKGPLYRVPIDERIQRVAERVNRRVYVRMVGADYSNLAENLFDDVRMQGDLGLSRIDMERIFDMEPKERLSGWKLIRCPTAKEVLAASDAIKAALAKATGK